jgi:hypothetical protein
MLSTLTLTGKLVLASGQPRAGAAISFIPHRTRTASEFGESMLVLSSPVTAKTNADGVFTVELRAANEAINGYTVILPDGKELNAMLLTPDMGMGSTTIDFNIFLSANGKSAF